MRVLAVGGGGEVRGETQAKATFTVCDNKSVPFGFEQVCVCECCVCGWVDSCICGMGGWLCVSVCVCVVCVCL